MTIQQASLVTRYQQIRQRTRGITTKLIDKLPKNAFQEGGKKLGFLRNGTLVFGSEDETSVLMDYCLHDLRERGKNAFERELEESPPADAEELMILNGMSRARYSLFIVEGTEPGMGIHLRDLLRDETVFVMDVNLSSSAQEGLVLASRIVTIDGISMSTGASLPIAVIPQGKRSTFVQEYMPQVHALDQNAETAEQASNLTAMLIRTCVENGASSRMRYAEPGEEVDLEPMPIVERHREWSRPVSKAERAKLNKRCPCGSGRKFKNCCGGMSKR